MAEGSKTALIAGRRRLNTDFRGFGFSEEPMEAGHYPVFKTDS